MINAAEYKACYFRQTIKKIEKIKSQIVLAIHILLKKPVID